MPAGSKAVRRLAWIAAASIVIAGMFAIAYLHASNVGTCVNGVLGSRNQITARVSNDNINYHVADKAYNDAEKAILTAPMSERVTLFPTFIATLKAKDAAAGALVAALKEQHSDQVAHPLGKC